MSRVGLRRGANGGRENLALSADVNLTSLVDVAFTLLVIFIITAPILQGGVEVNLPRADVRPVTTTDDLFIVSLTSDGKLFLEETEITIEEFEESFAQLATAAGTERVYIRADSAARYGPVLRVVATAQRAGVAAALIGESDFRPAGRR